VAGMKKTNEHAEPTKVERYKKQKKQKNFTLTGLAGRVLKNLAG